MELADVRRTLGTCNPEQERLRPRLQSMEQRLRAAPSDGLRLDDTPALPGARAADDVDELRDHDAITPLPESRGSIAVMPVNNLTADPLLVKAAGSSTGTSVAPVPSASATSLQSEARFRLQEKRGSHIRRLDHPTGGAQGDACP